MSNTQSITTLLLQAKLFRPRIPGRLVQRKRLLQTLDEAYRRRLVLVSAPAGYGKTTLVNLWLEKVEEAYAWISLDERDNNLQLFVAYLAAAVRSIYPSAAADVWSLVNTSPLPDPARLADLFLGSLEALPGPLLLVLDDYHAVPDLAVSQFMSRLVTWLPATVHLVLITRSDPALALTRLRARRQMAEIRGVDLNFTRHEAADLLANYLDDLLDEETTALLHERTEGWPTGLQLAAISLRESGDPETFARRFANSSHRLVSDYLLDEVLVTLNEQQTIDLIRTSLLDQFCAPLCEAVAGTETGNNSGGRFVDALWRDNLFVVALDDAGVWYRYHHLFRDLLRKRLRQLYTEEMIAEMHLRAGAWYKDEGMVEPAMAHFIEGGDLSAALRLLETSFLPALNQDDWRPLERWIALLPPEAQHQPYVQIVRAFIHHYHFQFLEVIRLTDAAEAGFELASDRRGGDGPAARERQLYLGLINTLRATTLGALGDPARSLTHARQALRQLTPEAAVPYSLAEFRYIESLRCTGQSHKALAFANRTLRDLTIDQPDARSLRLLMAIGNYYHAQADLAGSQATALTLRDLARKAGSYVGYGWGMYGLGWVHYERDDLAAAERLLREVLDHRFQIHGRTVVECAYGLSLTYLAQGKQEAAQQTAVELREFLLDRGAGSQLPLAEVLALCVALHQAAFTPSPLMVEELTQQMQLIPYSDLWHTPLITVVRAHLRLGRPENLEKALTLLADLRTHAAAMHNPRKVMQALAMETIALAAHGSREPALAALQEAVLLGEAGGALHTTADAGPGLIPFLRHLGSTNVAVEYVQRLLAVLGDQGPAHVKHTGQAPLTRDEAAAGLLDYAAVREAALTNRELDVLTLLARRLSNKEIAAMLSLSPHTVKKHSQNLYKKLGVKNRREAVARAAVLGLLSAHT